MRLSRLGSLHQCRLSFMRVLLRRMATENWRFERRVFDIDDVGVGHAIYAAHGPERSYSLVAFAHDLPDELRSDRVIAEAWDATFALFDGIPTQADIERLARNVPLQEAGRISERELCLSRANRSVRLWKHVVEALASGQQPDAAVLRDVGYLMRTTAVYGSGKFGAADRETYADRPELSGPFQAEMMSVYLTRWFVRDLVEHTATCVGGTQAVRIDPAMAAGLGIGNSTGLGMAPFLVNHPVLLNNWIAAREEALRRVRAMPQAGAAEVAMFRDRFSRVQSGIAQWTTRHEAQLRKLAELRGDCQRLASHLAGVSFKEAFPWDRLYEWAATEMGEEGQELLVSLMLEPYGAMLDFLANEMSENAVGLAPIAGEEAVAQTKQHLEAVFGWAKSYDWQSPEARARVWYVSEEKLEPRLGERFEEPVADYEQPLAPARDAVRAMAALDGWAPETPIAEFLKQLPEHRHIVRRVQTLAKAPYGEIRDNTIARDMMPIDMLRAKLSFFGATRFDPRSDRWVRICMFAGAPYPTDLTAQNADDWVFCEAAT